ncbi:hypothetical protein ASPZODRAFT_22299 [Penicilliopsis zonata CBS 506.65]|uniref:Uncharacterized protein n=1 Tax=Penicilliopsis zonata CBS 506.65 TaxID=1073090 RepID=A0A1L9SR46_9EURO|nr:hypothetical protein ASPZODRAFT_22299 [Penicilliopsis zonata CBS 506.65]OJJ49551.1 hypothetical protein ASPZODRAFT_22299 [Penicilliopsis zonata CBS 506.65]
MEQANAGTGAAAGLAQGVQTIIHRRRPSARGRRVHFAEQLVETAPAPEYHPEPSSSSSSEPSSSARYHPSFPSYKPQMNPENRTQHPLPLVKEFSFLEILELDELASGRDLPGRNSLIVTRHPLVSFTNPAFSHLPIRRPPSPDSPRLTQPHFGMSTVPESELSKARQAASEAEQSSDFEDMDDQDISDRDSVQGSPSQGTSAQSTVVQDVSHDTSSHGTSVHGASPRSLLAQSTVLGDTSHGSSARGAASRSLLAQSSAFEDTSSLGLSYGLSSRGLSSRGLSSRGLSSHGLSSHETSHSPFAQSTGFQDTSFHGLFSRGTSSQRLSSYGIPSHEFSSQNISAQSTTSHGTSAQGLFSHDFSSHDTSSCGSSSQSIFAQSTVFQDTSSHSLSAQGTSHDTSHATSVQSISPRTISQNVSAHDTSSHGISSHGTSTQGISSQDNESSAEQAPRAKFKMSRSLAAMRETFEPLEDEPPRRFRMTRSVRAIEQCPEPMDDIEPVNELVARSSQISLSSDPKSSNENTTAPPHAEHESNGKTGVETEAEINAGSSQEVTIGSAGENMITTAATEVDAEAEPQVDVEAGSSPEGVSGSNEERLDAPAVSNINVLHPWQVIDYHLYLCSIERGRTEYMRRNGLYMLDAHECRPFFFDEFFREKTFEAAFVGRRPKLLIANLPIAEDGIHFNGSQYVLYFDYRYNTLYARRFNAIPADITKIKDVWDKGGDIYSVGIDSLRDLLYSCFRQPDGRVRMGLITMDFTDSMARENADDPGLEVVIAVLWCQFVVDHADILFLDPLDDPETIKQEYEFYMEECRLVLQRASYRAWFGLREGVSKEDYKHKAYVNRFLNELYTFEKSAEDGSLKDKSWHAPSIETCDRVRQARRHQVTLDVERSFEEMFASPAAEPQSAQEVVDSMLERTSTETGASGLL